MNILGVGFPELILIFIIMLIVAGPKRMIRWAYVLGVYMGKLRNLWGEVIQLLQQEVDQAGLDVQLPKDLPTRQNINTWAEKAARDYSVSVERELERSRDALEIPKDTFKTSTTKSSWMPSQTKNTISDEAEAENTHTPPENKAIQSSNNVNTKTFGTWSHSVTSSTETSQQSADEDTSL